MMVIVLLRRRVAGLVLAAAALATGATTGWLSGPATGMRLAAGRLPAEHLQEAQRRLLGALPELDRDVVRAWQGAPEHWSAEERVQAVAQSLQLWLGDRLDVRTGDVDGDHISDLVLHPPPDYGQAAQDTAGHAWHNADRPLHVYRAADLHTGRVRAHTVPDLANPRGRFRAVEAIGDLNRDNRPELAVSFAWEGGSATTLHWSIHRWDGSEFAEVFTAEVDDWQGENWVVLQPGTVLITCRPLGRYEQKGESRLLEEVWAWQGDRYVIRERRVAPPRSAKDLVNEAEPHLTRQHLDSALALYRRALSLPAADSWGYDWHGYARLRIGQVLALRGQATAAKAEWRRAIHGGGRVGKAAEILLHEWSGTGSLAGALAAVLRLGTDAGDGRAALPWRFQGWDLAPPELVLLAYLAEAGRPEAQALQAAGIPAEAVVAADLDGDGRQEVWVRFAYGHGYEQSPVDLLAVRSPAGWQVTDTGTGGFDLLGPRRVLGSQRQELGFRKRPPIIVPDEITLGWDGRQVLGVSIHDGKATNYRETLPVGPPVARCK